MKPIALVAALLPSGLALATSRSTTPAPPTCREVTDQPAAYIGTKVTLLASQHLISSTTVDGKTVMVQIYACSDALGFVEDDRHLFALDPRAAISDSAAGNSVARRVTGVVQAALGVPMPVGRFQVKRVMPFLTGVTLHAP